MDFSLFAEKLSFKDGIWFSPNKADVSYPENGHNEYFEIEDTSFWFNYRNKCITYLIKVFQPKNFLLDIGGGNGFVSASIQQTNVCTPVLLEPGVQGILNAKRRGVKNLICSTLDEVGIAPGSIPSVGLFDVLEHIEDDNKFLDQISQILEPGGFVFITVPAFQFLWSNDDVVAGHYRRYTLSHLKKMFEDKNYKICFSSYFFMFLVFPLFLLKTLPTYFFNKKSNVESNTQEHVPSATGRALVDFILNIEFKLFKKGMIPFGTSCIIVAQKMEKNNDTNTF